MCWLRRYFTDSRDTISGNDNTIVNLFNLDLGKIEKRLIIPRNSAIVSIPGTNQIRPALTIDAASLVADQIGSH